MFYCNAGILGFSQVSHQPAPSSCLNSPYCPTTRSEFYSALETPIPFGSALPPVVIQVRPGQGGTLRDRPPAPASRIASLCRCPARPAARCGKWSDRCGPGKGGIVPIWPCPAQPPLLQREYLRAHCWASLSACVSLRTPLTPDSGRLPMIIQAFAPMGHGSGLDAAPSLCIACACMHANALRAVRTYVPVYNDTHARGPQHGMC
jgi:hypothetical protein